MERFNGLDRDAARRELLACCSSPTWVEIMLDERPFPSVDEALERADDALRRLSEADVDDALAGHPRIGERASVGHGGFSDAEQAGVDGADAPTLRALADGNREYEQRFGHVYLVFASGKSAQELLRLLRTRLGNDPAAERAVAARRAGEDQPAAPRADAGPVSSVSTHVLDAASGTAAAGVAVRLLRVADEGDGDGARRRRHRRRRSGRAAGRTSRCRSGPTGSCSPRPSTSPAPACRPSTPRWQ